jgi:hypothetical protein
MRERGSEIKKRDSDSKRKGTRKFWIVKKGKEVESAFS